MGNKAGVASALAREGYVMRFQGRYADAMARCKKALTLVSPSLGNKVTPQDKSILALIYKNIGICHLGLGQTSESLKALQRALQFFEELDDTYDVGLVHQDLGMGYELAGDLDRALGHYQAALPSWERLGTLGPWAHTLNNLSVIHYLQGEYDKALQLLSDALTKARQAGNLRVEAVIWASLGDLQHDTGAYEQARQAYADGLQAATRAGDGFVTTYTLVGLGNTFRLQGDLAQARKQLLKALEHAEHHNSTYETGLCHTSLGMLFDEEGDLVAARRHLNRAVELFKAGGFKRELARAYLYLSQVDFSSRQRERAWAYLEQALALSDQLGFDQFLVVDGQRLQPLLRCAMEQGIRSDILPGLLDRVVTHQAQMSKRVEPAIQIEHQPTLKIYALGQARVELDGMSVQWASTQSRDLFFCLLQHPEGLRKEEIGEIFWSEHSPQKLEGIFRSSLYRLRRALFRESVMLEEGLYLFNRQSDYWFDVEAFEKLLDQAEHTLAAAKGKKIAVLEEALALYQGDYLNGVYADWCALERERLREQYLTALETLAGLYTDRGETQRAIELYQNVLAQDQYRETAHRELMRCYYRLGDRAAAIRQYQTCAMILRKELGVSPMPETEELHLQIAR
jgi:two-component SAPR family response regulator/Flp pilus assembly protein TadD